MARKVVSGIMLILLFLASEVLSIRAAGSSTTIVNVDPPCIVGPNVAPSCLFTVNINIYDVVDLYAWQVAMSFDPDVLQVTDVIYGVFLSGLKFSATSIDNVAGLVLFCETLLGAPVGVDGSGWLATVAFQVAGTGETELNITDPVEVSPGTFVETLLVDSSFPYPLLIPFTPQNGYFNNLVDQLQVKVGELDSQGAFSNPGTVASLIAKLNVAQKLVGKRELDEAKSILESDFIPQVQNLSGIHITVEAANILIESAEYALSHM